MTDQIPRLEKEVNDLKSRHDDLWRRLKERQQDLKAARVEKLTAEYAAQGIVPGCKVVAVRKMGDGTERRTICGFAGVKTRGWGEASVDLTKIRKDGSVGKQPAGIYLYDRLELAPDQ